MFQDDNMSEVNLILIITLVQLRKHTKHDSVSVTIDMYFLPVCQHYLSL